MRLHGIKIFIEIQMDGIGEKWHKSKIEIFQETKKPNILFFAMFTIDTEKNLNNCFKLH